jgi:hypothetical protein
MRHIVERTGATRIRFEVRVPIRAGESDRRPAFAPLPLELRLRRRVHVWWVVVRLPPLKARKARGPSAGRGGSPIFTTKLVESPVTLERTTRAGGSLARRASASAWTTSVSLTAVKPGETTARTLPGVTGALQHVDDDSGARCVHCGAQAAGP